ncbi:MAG: polyvinyl alcohol dehydrogenase (cytochrome) [Gammaproteobacteria bacterium]|jgi:polyvinyl alcohol dehydrogenase (cytochrome)
MPSPAALKERSPLDLYTVITSRPMAAYARHLSHVERRAIAEFPTAKSLGDIAIGAAAIPQAAYCAHKPNAPLKELDSGWNGWGNGLENMRYPPAARAGLAAQDVSKIKPKWVFGVPAVATMSGHPVVADGRLFFGTISGLVVALDAASGCALWVFEASTGVRAAPILGKLNDGKINLFFGDLGGNVYAIDPNTGSLEWRMLADEHTHLRITGAPVYHGNRLYVPLSSLEEVAGAMPDYECWTFQGAVLSADATNGGKIWKRSTLSAPPKKQGMNTLGVQRWAPSGAAIWAVPTLEPTTNSIYIVTGDSYSDPAAPESDTVMAIAMDTGDVKWVTQTTADYAFTVACMDSSPESLLACPDSYGPDLDFGASAVLITKSDGTRLLLAGQKSGWMYALDPNNGKIIWKTEVGPGGIEGGIEWGFAVDGEKAYVALSSAFEKGPGEAGGIAALDLNDGHKIWEVDPHQGTCAAKERCNTGQLAAVSVIDGAVFSGSLDGSIRAYDTATGAVLWAYDTARPFDAVNGIDTYGGALNGPGPAIANGHVYVNSGYGRWNVFMPGNALIALRIEGK